ncbi:MAG TPA: hypothetical protein VFQ99_04400, partial [Gallionella sp.]|nr:hypothetical protein [Gallionella sp.]
MPGLSPFTLRRHLTSYWHDGVPEDIKAAGGIWEDQRGGGRRQPHYLALAYGLARIHERDYE